MRRAVLAAALLLTGGAAEQARELAGQPLAALLTRPSVGLTLRQVSGGHQRAVSEGIRRPGLLSVAAERYVFGHGCGEAGCGIEGLFVGWDAETGRVFLIVVEDGSAVLTVPPRRAPWPEALRAGVAGFNPAIAARMRFGE